MAMDLTNNPNQRTPCVLILDASESMSWHQPSGKIPINELNAGLQTLATALKEDSSARTRVQLSIVCVGGPRNEASLLMDWTDVINFDAFPLSAAGSTPLAEGLLLALKVIEDGKKQLNSSGISYTRPWIMIISDGDPTSPAHLWDQALGECKLAQDQRKVEIFSIAVEGADLDKFKLISTKPVIQLEGVKFRELFVWLSSSLSAASRSRPGDKIELPSTDPWRNVGI